MKYKFYSTGTDLINFETKNASQVINMTTDRKVDRRDFHCLQLISLVHSIITPYVVITIAINLGKVYIILHILK